MSVSSSGQIPFRRLTDPLMVPVATTSTTMAVPAGFIPQDATSFRVVNPNNFWVRLRGASLATSANPSALTITATQGWLFPPGFSGTFTSQFPEYLATISVGAGAGTGTLELSYGIGSSGESVGQLLAAGGSTNGTVTVANVPLPVAQNGAPWSFTLSGTAAVTGTVGITGTVAVTQSGTWNVGITGTAITITRGTASMATGQVNMTTGNTAYQIVPARSTRRSVTLVPTSQFTYFYGNSGVTVANGAAAPNGAVVTLETTAAIFAVSGSAGVMTFVEHF